MKKKLSQEDVFDMLARENFVGLPRLQEGDMTAQKYAQRYGISSRSAQVHLRVAVSRGILGREYVVRVDGRKIYRYFPIDGATANNGSGKSKNAIPKKARR